MEKRLTSSYLFSCLSVPSVESKHIPPHHRNVSFKANIFLGALTLNYHVMTDSVITNYLLGILL